MKFSTTSAKVIAAAIFGFTPLVHSWRITFYDSGSACGNTSTNYVIYQGTDTNCHIVGSADNNCAGFSNGGWITDSSLCGAHFGASSMESNYTIDPSTSAGECVGWLNTACTSGSVELPSGCFSRSDEVAVVAWSC